jgi:hypothetical protein
VSRKGGNGVSRICKGRKEGRFEVLSRGFVGCGFDTYVDGVGSGMVFVEESGRVRDEVVGRYAFSPAMLAYTLGQGDLSQCIPHTDKRVADFAPLEVKENNVDAYVTRVSLYVLFLPPPPPLSNFNSSHLSDLKTPPPQ